MQYLLTLLYPLGRDDKYSELYMSRLSDQTKRSMTSYLLTISLYIPLILWTFIYSSTLMIPPSDKKTDKIKLDLSIFQESIQEPVQELQQEEPQKEESPKEPEIEEKKTIEEIVEKQEPPQESRDILTPTPKTTIHKKIVKKTKKILQKKAKKAKK